MRQAGDIDESTRPRKGEGPEVGKVASWSTLWSLTPRPLAGAMRHETRDPGGSAFSSVEEQFLERTGAARPSGKAGALGPSGSFGLSCFSSLSLGFLICKVELIIATAQVHCEAPGRAGECEGPGTGSDTWLGLTV